MICLITLSSTNKGTCVAEKDEMYDYHRAMTDAVATIPSDPDQYVWVMNEEHRKRYRYFLEHVMGAFPDDSQSFGIGILTGEPPNGEPFELCQLEEFFKGELF